MSVKITFLGTGTSQGIPVIACNCLVCKSTDPKDNRLRTSALIETDGTQIVIDSGPDFRAQMLRAGLQKLDAILFTHQHRDHTAGLDDVRSFNQKYNAAMPIYGNKMVIDQIKRDFHYVFESNYPGIPQLEIHQIENSPFRIGNVKITPIEVMHHKLLVLGFRIGDLTYITDANSIAEKEIEKVYGSKILVLNALQINEHVSHFTLEEALEVIAKVNPERAYLTHMSHNLGLHDQISIELPTNVYLAYDGLSVTC